VGASVLGYGGDPLGVADAAGAGVGGELHLVGLGGAGEEGSEQCCAGGAAEVSGEVGEAGDLVGLGGWHADVVERADGDEDQWEADDLEGSPEGDGAKAGVEREAGEIVEACGGDAVADADEEAGVHAADEASSDNHHGHKDEAAGGEHHAGALCGVAEEGLEVLRDEDRGAEEHHAEDELEEDGGAEVAVFEELEVDDGVGVVPLPKDEGDEENGGDPSDGDDHGGAEPVFFLALVEEEFEAAYAAGDEGEAGEVDLGAAGFDEAFFEVRWVFDHAGAEPHGKESYGEIDEEDPVPVEVVGDPAAESGADGGGDDDGHTVDGEGLASLFNGEGVGEDGLLGGSEAAAAGALQDAGDDEERQRRGNAAEERADGEDGDAGEVVTLASEAVGEPAGDGKHDGGGDEIAGEDPGGFFLRRAERAGDVREGDVGDGGVEHFHERGEGNREGDGPGIVFRFPVVIVCHISFLI